MKINKKNIELFNELKLKAQEGEGNILLITGESGFGKSYLIKQLINECVNKENRILNVYVQNEVPIGNINVHNLQPLKPFAKALEVILESKNVTAKTKLAMNMSLTALTSLPFIGDVFYAAKELSRDWKQYKKEKTNEAIELEENRADELINSFAIKSEKEPIVIFMDNMQFVDSASVELLNKLKTQIHKYKILVVLAFRESEVSTPQVPFYHFLNDAKDLDKIELRQFTKDEVIELSKIYINNYKENEEFDNWLFEKSLGNPGELFEYFDYFKSIETFDNTGNLSINLESDLIPTSGKAALANSLNELSIEEKDLLASAAQGNEFSVVLLSEILNADVLIIIRKLKTIQEKTKIIRSIGSFKRYGTKTTVFQFTQVFYYNYFKDYLEFEEEQHIHSLISNYLKKQLTNIDNSEEKKEIMAYIISHSEATGDNEEVEKTMSDIRQLAKDTNDKELLSFVGDLNKDEKENQLNSLSSTNGNGSGSLNIMSFSDIRKIILRDYSKGEYLSSIQLSQEFLKNEEEYLTKKELILLLTMTAKLEINSGDFPNAKKHISQAEKLLEQEEDKSLECLLLNINAALHNKQKHFSRAGKYLRKAADLALDLPLEMRLLTLSNISILLEQESPEESVLYKTSAEKLKKELEFNNWWN